MLIYNFGSPIDGPTWKEFFSGLLDINKIYPLHNIIYFPFLFFFRSKILYRIYVWLGHFLPALLMDAANICMGRSPRMWKLIIKRDKDFEMYESLIIKDWNYSTDNVQAMWDHLSEKDQQLFNFNMMGFDWTKYFMDYHNGIRHYLLNEDDSTLEISRIKYKR
ncbi:PREDICTED: fatty acyl-CoA reductase 1-like isoform X2 [Wasmannia auropunctata]|uniref:fatty acyl-CoA reductase 1-like isoform X2 n=2 Tax=Wasmannia auropunctata TaxID=64793 RepID=UPI0005EF5A13|nr:PREDICTED: fatty acyl-CoA reductase 1-like isoform X2 [Wasmannia auropunctata]